MATDLLIHRRRSDRHRCTCCGVRNRHARLALISFASYRQAERMQADRVEVLRKMLALLREDLRTQDDPRWQQVLTSVIEERASELARLTSQSAA